MSAFHRDKSNLKKKNGARPPTLSTKMRVLRVGSQDTIDNASVGDERNAVCRGNGRTAPKKWTSEFEDGRVQAPSQHK